MLPWLSNRGRMKFFVAALALLLVGFASAEIKLRYPEFIPLKTHIYDVWINKTSGIPGMHSQVSKSAINMEAKIYAVSKHDVIISIEKVLVSNSVASIGSKTDKMDMKPNRDLEEHLKVPFKASFENGKVKNFTLDREETLESRSIKTSLLSLWEVHLDKVALESSRTSSHWPITYNLTKTSPVGNYFSHYIVTSSPFPDFPKDRKVINITRTDNYETIPYQAYHTHHNFEEQGCPGVCKQDHIENRFHAGCPAEWEPYQTPMKKSFVQHHNLRKVKGQDIVIAEIITSKETHVADIYDQNMEVAIETFIRYQSTRGGPIPEPTGQTTHTDLNEWRSESNVEAINRHCKYTTPEQAIPKVRELLNSITQIVHKGSIEGDEKNVGEKLVLLQKGLTLLKRKDLEKIQEDIVTYEEISKASAEEKIKRQIWLDSLPLIGTDDSVSFLVHLIKESINEKYHGVISLWEAKNLLEDLPMNIIKPSSRTLEEMSVLLEQLQDRSVPGYGMYYSAAHIAVARVIRNLCAVNNGIPEAEEEVRPNHLQQLLKETDDDYKNSKCPRTEAKKFVTDIEEKLKQNTDRLKRIIYYEAVSQTGLKSALPILKNCVDGHISGVTPSYRDYVRTVCIHALHNVVQKYPKLVKDIILPVYANKTEAPKIRSSAFGLFIKTYPTLGDLQHVAEVNGDEPSQEVCSYVTSTLETVGNSTIPCDQLTANRIKKVMAQAKRCDIGTQHAKNIKTTKFDAVRRLGLEHVLEYIPSNESFIPSTMFTSIGYNADSFKESYMQYAINAQGFSSKNIFDDLLRSYKMDVAPTIPKSKESQIFPEIEMADRANEFWRFTLFEKQFYSMSYYYMDDPEYQRGDMISLLKRYFKNFFTWESNGKIHGHLVKLWLPSSYQSKALATTLPYPVQFEMRNPMILSLKLRIDVRDKGISVDAHPTYYHSMLYSNEMLNLGDCKHVGVYHEKKVAITYPFKLNYFVEQGETVISYSFPEFEQQKKKKIVNYHSEAGTYTKKHTLAVQPSTTERRTIKTIPSQFVRNSSWAVFGFPSFETQVLTEDISSVYKEIPRKNIEVVDQYVKDFLNAGWRRKSINIYRKADSQMWGPKTEVKMRVTYKRTFESREHVNHDDTWANAINVEKHDETDYLAEDRAVNDKVTGVSHVNDRLTISVVQKVSERISNKVHLDVDHNSTLEGDLHSWKLNTNATASGISLGVVIKGSTFYTNKPNEFNYDVEGYGKQRGVVWASIWFPEIPRPFIIAKGILRHKPLVHYLNKELQTQLSAKDFYPETHDLCIRDQKLGHSQSVACRKAIQDLAKFNELKLRIVSSQDLPPVVEDIRRKLELGVMHAYFKHLSIEKKHSARRSLGIVVTHIDKLTDEPVVDIVVTKPTEELKFHKVRPSFIHTVSSIYSAKETYLQKYTNNTYPATCSLSEKYLTTYDLKTIRLPRDASCSYVLTSHCVRHKKFAVIVKLDSENTEHREIHLYLGKHSIVLTPGTESKYEIKYDDKSYSVKYLQPIMLHRTEKIYAVVTRIYKGSNILEIHAEKAGIKVTYDGQHVKTQVHPRYKGELCGLCSEFNGEVVKEMTGCNGCLFSNVDDFTTSSALGSCYKPKASQRAICSNTDYDHADIYDQDEGSGHKDSEEKEYVPKEKRNKVLLKDDKVCISVYPIEACRLKDVPIKTEIKEIEFHCLPKSDSNARKLVKESKRRILGEVETKEVDMREKVVYPTLCVQQ